MMLMLFQERSPATAAQGSRYCEETKMGESDLSRRELRDGTESRINEIQRASISVEIRDEPYAYGPEFVGAEPKNNVEGSKLARLFDAEIESMST